ncbi:PPE domain-containing protein [Amycolatopsis orientalis]|uniref:PPE domain-containing protein n=1 Tax=Amycolatopsis orientalis TaxID=31958 RepID=UPI00041D2906|nr:PPE domain-containing protein [Amycolatopsis orientalis]
MFLLPIIAGYSAYNLATTKSGDFEASGGDRKIDCYNIWEKIVTGPGTGSIQEGQAAATRLKAGYQDRLTTIDNLSKEMDAAWTGKSAEAAQESGAHPLRAWMEDSGKKLADSDKYLGEQNTAFTTVKAKVQPVPKDPPKNNLLNSITPWTTDTDRAIRDYNQKGQANVDAFNEYFKASSENGKKMPTYSKMEGQNTNVDVNGGGKDKDGDGQGDRNGNNGMPPGGISTPPGSMPPGGMPNIPGVNTPGVNMPGSNIPGSNLPGSNLPGSNLPGSNIPGGHFNPNIPGSDYKPPSWNDGTHASGFTPPKIPGAGGFGPSGGGGGGGGFGGTDIPGAGGFGPDGGFGPGGAGFGPGGPGSASGAAIPGGAAGAGRGGMGPGGAGAAGAGRGAGGMMGGMGGMGAGGAKGKGAEDEERSSKYLVGDDPNDIFGTDELTAPPVIGE